MHTETTMGSPISSGIRLCVCVYVGVVHVRDVCVHV